MASLSFEEEFEGVEQEFVKFINEFGSKVFPLFNKDPVKFIEHILKYYSKEWINKIMDAYLDILKMTPDQHKEIDQLLKGKYLELRINENIKSKVEEIMKLSIMNQPKNEITKEQKQEETNIVPNGHDLKKLVLFEEIKDINKTKFDSITLSIMIHDNIHEFMRPFEWDWNIFEKDLNKHENYYYKCLINMITVEELQKFIKCLNSNMENQHHFIINDQAKALQKASKDHEDLINFCETLEGWK